jgi:serine/threonine protein phosphatase PrpC
MAFRLRAFGMTDVGRKRERNEDNLILVPQEGLYVVADGMGGHASGQLASRLAVTHITEFVCIQSKKPDVSWPSPPRRDRPDAANKLAASIQYANERIYIESCKDTANEGMGTTITALYDPDPQGPTLFLAHAGDSRIYRFRNKVLTQMTQDHSLLNHLLDTGKITPEEAEHFPNKNVIFRALGLKDYVEVDVQELPKRDGDLYLLCSDGLTDLVEDDIIAQILTGSETSLRDACQALIKIANHNGGVDNITAMLVYVEQVTQIE